MHYFNRKCHYILLIHMVYHSIMEKLSSLSDSKNLEGMKRYGIRTKSALGVPMPEIRKLAREAGKDNALAEKLWSSGVHEARILASLVDEPEKVKEEQMDNWARDFNSRDVCDQVCMNLFDKTPYAYRKAREWSRRDEEFVKRAAFALIAALAVHDKEADDERFINLLPVMVRESTDERNFVKKAVNWALRQTGKRNAVLNSLAVRAAWEMQKKDSPSAKWIASDALKELTSEKVKKKLSLT